jgi:DNA polymerase I-like protein with 3'-5' exonuclease and polymerase domains
MTHIPDVLRRANEAGVTLSVSGAEVLIGGNVDVLADGLWENLELLRTNGFLWDWCGAAAIDREAITFAEALGVEAVLAETETQAIAAAKEITSDATVIGLDIETALKPEFAPPRKPILINLDGTFSERNRFEARAPRAEPKPWRDPHMAEIKLLQLYAGGRRCFVFRGKALGLVLISRLIRERPLVAHNASFETSFLRAAGIQRQHPIECTMQAFGLLYGTMDRSLEHAAIEVLGIRPPKSLQTSDWAARRLSQGQVCYAASDAILALRLWSKLMLMLRRCDRFTTYELHRNAQPAVVAMEYRGMGFDRFEHGRQVEKWSRDFSEACHSFKESTGKSAPLRDDDLRLWIAEVARPEQLETWPRTVGGKLSAAADCIKWLILNGDPTVAPVLDIKARKKLIEAFGASLHRFISPVTGRIHAGFNIGKAENGRFSADTPNLQQLSSKGAGKDFRRCIVAAEGSLLVCADFSQIELRIAAWRFRDKVMTQAFADGKDTHAETVRLLGFNEVTPERRNLAKAVNFGSVYGLVEYAWSSFGLQLTEAEAQRHLDRFFATYSGIGQGRFDVWKQAKSCGAIPAGRYGRVVERSWVKVWVERGKPPFTMCANFPISGAASDRMLAAIPPVDRRLRRLRGGLILSVHDELVAEVHRDDAEAAKAALEEEMTKVFVGMFPEAPSNGVVSVGVGKNWLEAKS